MNNAAAASEAPAHTDKVLVAIIDGMPEHRRQVSKALMSFYTVVEFESVVEAAQVLHRTPPVAVLVDESAKPWGGREAIKRLREDGRLSKVRLIATAADPLSQFLGRAKEFGCDATLPKPFRRSQLITTISSLVNSAVESSWENMADNHRQALRMSLDTFNGISDLIDKGEPVDYSSVKDACAPLTEAVQRNDFRAVLDGVKGHDNYSYVHSLRVATLLSLFGHAMGLKGDDMLLLSSGGLLHDIGKMSIPHEVLNKNGRLTEDEFKVMRSHVDYSVSYIDACPSLPKGIGVIAGQHHEKLDGTGYPHGIKGAELNTLARMAAIVDVFSALTDRRCYKPPMPPEKALKIMTEEMTTHLDQAMLRLFVDLLLSSVQDSAGG